MASQILRQLGFNWLECADEQGIFYFNEVTQQSSDTIPAELMGGMPQAQPSYGAMTPSQPSYGAMTLSQPSYGAMANNVAAPQVTQAKVLSGGIASLPGGMTPPGSYMPPVMQPANGSYMPPMVQGSCTPMMPPPMQAQPQQMFVTSYTPGVPSYTPLPQQMQQQQQQQLAIGVPSYSPLPQQQQQLPSQQQLLQQLQSQQLLQPQQCVPSYTPPPQAQPQFTPAPSLPPQLAPAMQKMAFGDWAIYQDELGMFYMQVSTGVQFENPPAELTQAYQQYRAEQDQQHMQQIRQIEMQKQMIDQQLAQQTESLRMNFGGMPIPA